MVIRDLPYAERTLGRLLERGATEHGERLFVRLQDQSVSYRGADQEANRAANALAGVGVEHGDRVAIMLPNSLAFFWVWFGTAKLGAVEVPINTEFKRFQISHILQDAAVKVLVIHTGYLGVLRQLDGELPQLHTIILVGGVYGEPLLMSGVRCVRFEDLTADASAEAPGVAVAPGDLLAILHTSGTTGPSKGVMVCHHHEYILGRNIARDMELGPDDLFYNFYPLFHNTGQGIITWGVLQTGGAMLLRERFSASQFWGDVKGQGCTVFYYIGAILHILLESSPPDVGEHSLRLAWGIAAGAEEFVRFQDRFRIPLRGGYGSTEANIPCFLPWTGAKPGASGRVLPGWQVQVVDESDLALPIDKIGEIVVRSEEPNVMMQGYFGRPEATVAAWKNLWFHTGDAGYFDADGDLFFVDRIRDVIRRRGENISSYEVECVVNQLPAVLESAAVAVPSALGEDEVKVVVVLKPGASLEVDELIGHCQASLPGFAVPRYAEMVDALPKTETDKVKKHLLREQGFTPTTWDRVSGQYCQAAEIKEAKR